MSLRSPALHFVLIGAALFWLLDVRATDHAGGASDQREPIVLSAADIEGLQTEWHERFGAAPDVAMRQQLIQNAIDEEILYREAMAQHLDTQAPVVRDRLARLASFVEEFPGDDAAALERAARRLGLQRRDIVVRRHLVQSMRLLLARPAANESISDEQLQDYYEQHTQGFAQPARVRLTHVFINRDRAGSDAIADATRLLATFRERDTSPAEAKASGDPFLPGNDIGPLSDDELGRVFGPDFVAAVHALPLGAWSGPIASAYGQHLVWVHERVPTNVPALADVHAQVVHQYRAERRQQLLRQRLDQLRKRYLVRVDEAAAH